MRKNRVLIVDDDGAIRVSLARALESEDFEVAAAGSGREAVKRFESFKPHLILFDLNMPDMDGWQAYDSIGVSHPMVPVIVITARPHQYEDALNVGVDALMEKPLNLPLLEATIKKLISENRQDRVKRLTDPGFSTEYLTTEPTEYSARSL